MARNGMLRGFGALGLLATATIVSAQAARVDPVVTRVAGYRALGAAFKNVNDTLRTDAPQLAVIRASAQQISVAARAQYRWFPAGSGPAAYPRTAAKAEIWTDRRAFRRAQDAFATQTRAFNRAAAGTDMEAIRTATRNLGQSCGGCHRSFRIERN